MVLNFDRAALTGYISSAEGIQSAMARSLDGVQGQLRACTGRYNRIYSDLEERSQQAWRRISECESQLRYLEQEYDSCMSETDDEDGDGGRDAALRRAREISREMAEVREDLDRAQEEYDRCQRKLLQLSALWQRYGEPAQREADRAEGVYSSFSTTSANANEDLRSFLHLADQARSALQGGTSQGSSGAQGGSVQGSGGSHSCGGTQTAMGSHSGDTGRGTAGTYSAGGVRTESGGRQVMDLQLGGSTQTYPLSKSGAARAYRKAVASGDREMITRCNALFELETLRQDLELTGGDPQYLQMGGYHREVKGRPNYESHHIPQRSVQSENADDLPAIALDKLDHRQTDSYAGKSGRAVRSHFPPEENFGSYREVVADAIRQGDYMTVVRNELYNLRDRFGHRYDGGIRQYLDTLADMIAKRGVPTE